MVYEAHLILSSIPSTIRKRKVPGCSTRLWTGFMLSPLSSCRNRPGPMPGKGDNGKDSSEGGPKSVRGPEDGAELTSTVCQGPRDVTVPNCHCSLLGKRSQCRCHLFTKGNKGQKGGALPSCLRIAGELATCLPLSQACLCWWQPGWSTNWQMANWEAVRGWITLHNALPFLPV